MSLEQLKKELKNNIFRNIYLLYGEETYLIRHYKKALIDAILPNKNEMNYTYFSGKYIDFGNIIGLANTLPFFSEYRVILIENSSLFSTQNDFSEKIKDLPSSTILIFVEETIDKRTKLYKALSKQGLVVSFERAKVQELVKWVISFFKANHLNLSVSDADFLVERVGTSMDILYREMEKLLSYSYEKKEVTREAILEVCPETLQDRIFKLMDCIGKKERESALNYYYDLLERRESSIKILALMIRHFHILYTIRLLNKDGKQNEASTILKLPPFAIKNYVSMADNFTRNTLKEALEFATELDKDVKTGLIHEKIAVEQIIIRYSS